jgi:hypothetical protein
MILALCSAPLIFGMQTVDMQADGACPTGPDHQADGSMCLKKAEALEKLPEPFKQEKHHQAPLRRKSLPAKLRPDIVQKPETVRAKLTNIHHDLCTLCGEIDSENSNRPEGDRQQVLRALWSLQNTDIFLSLPQEQRESLSTKRYALFGYETSSK